MMSCIMSIFIVFEFFRKLLAHEAIMCNRYIQWYCIGYLYGSFHRVFEDIRGLILYVEHVFCLSARLFILQVVGSRLIRVNFIVTRVILSIIRGTLLT